MNTYLNTSTSSGVKQSKQTSLLSLYAYVSQFSTRFNANNVNYAPDRLQLRYELEKF